MEQPLGAVKLGGTAKLTTIDCVAQSLAVGPIFSAAALGGILAFLAGGVGPFVIILTTVGILGLGYLISELAKRFSGSGTVYEFIANTLGKKPAVFAAGAYHAAASALVAAIPIVGGIFAKAFCAAHLGFDPPWWVMAIIIGAVIVLLNALGVQVSVKSQLVIIVASLIPFLILAIAIVADGGPGGNTGSVFNPGNVAEGGSIFKGLMFAILMFVGFELSAALGEETENPQKSIPKAVLATILIVAAFYLITQYVGAIGSGGPNQLPFDFGVLAKEYVGNWLSVLVELAIILDMLAVGIGFCAATSRGIFTLARDGMLPKPLAAVSKRNVPLNAIVLELATMVVILVVALAKYGTELNPIENGDPTIPPGPMVFKAFLVMSTIGAFVISVVYVLLCLGGIVYFSKQGHIRAVIGAVIGLLTAGAGVLAQFISGTAPVGDALWGRHLGLIVLGAVAVWLVLNLMQRPDKVELAGQHAVQHAEH